MYGVDFILFPFSVHPQLEVVVVKTLLGQRRKFRLYDHIIYLLFDMCFIADLRLQGILVTAGIQNQLHILNEPS